MSAAQRLLDRMRATKHGWKPRDFRRLYEGFGFERHEGGGHTIYQHPDYPMLVATVARHQTLATGYAVDAVKLIDLLTELQAQEEGQDESS